MLNWYKNLYVGDNAKKETKKADTEDQSGCRGH